jgi:2-methylcitrate dehydratase PrpD
MAIETTSLTDQLAGWIESLTWEAVPPHVIEQARLCLLDGLGCGLAGSSTPEGRAAASAVKDFDPSESCALWGISRRGSAPSAALVNGTAMHAQEFDDVSHTIGHPGLAVIPVAVGLGEWIGASGQDILLAIIAGYEIGSRIAAALDFTVHSSRGWHPVGTCGGFAAAATAARLLKLGRPELTSALGLAGTTAGGVHAYKADGTMSKRYHAGHSAHDGIVATLLARRGFTGPAWILEAPWGGLLGMMTDGADAGRVVNGLGTSYAICDTEFKLFPSCYGAHPATEAALTLRTKGADPNQVEAVTVRTNELTARFCGSTNGRSDLAAQMSIPYAVGAALVHSRASVAEYTDVTRQDARLWDLERRVRVEVDRSLPEQGSPSIVEVRLRDGRVLRETVDSPRGSLTRPATQDDLIGKFRDLAKRVLSNDQVSELETLVMGPKLLTGTSSLWTLLQPQ